MESSLQDLKKELPNNYGKAISDRLGINYITVYRVFKGVKTSLLIKEKVVNEALKLAKETRKAKEKARKQDQKIQKKIQSRVQKVQ